MEAGGGGWRGPAEEIARNGSRLAPPRGRSSRLMVGAGRWRAQRRTNGMEGLEARVRAAALARRL